MDRDLAGCVKELLGCIDAAISGGDWVVDGACDPDISIERAKFFLSKWEAENGTTD
jgi:hypothetical protein